MSSIIVLYCTICQKFFLVTTTHNTIHLLLIWYILSHLLVDKIDFIVMMMAISIGDDYVYDRDYDLAMTIQNELPRCCFSC